MKEVRANQQQINNSKMVAVQGPFKYKKQTLQMNVIEQNAYQHKKSEEQKRHY